MKKYPFRANIHIFNISSVCFILTLFFLFNWIDQRFSNYLLLLFASVALFNFINSLMTNYELYEDMLILKSLTKKIIIGFNDVECIMEQPAGKFVGLSIGIFASSKKISVTPWTKDYIELLKLIISRCQYNGKVKIDPGVINIISTK